MKKIIVKAMKMMTQMNRTNSKVKKRNIKKGNPEMIINETIILLSIYLMHIKYLIHIKYT